MYTIRRGFLKREFKFFAVKFKILTFFLGKSKTAETEKNVSKNHSYWPSLELNLFRELTIMPDLRV